MTCFVAVKCSSCGATVTRRQRSASDSNPVLCSACCAVPGADAEAYRLAARAALEQQLGMFDATGQYNSAKLDANPETAWGRNTASTLAQHRLSVEAGGLFRGGLMFFGPSGIGKTRAAIAVCREVGDYDPAGVLIRTEQSLFDSSLAPWELLPAVTTLTAGKTLIVIDDIGVCYRRPDQIHAAWKGLCDSIATNPNPVLLIGTTNRPGWDGESGLTPWVGAQVTSRLRQFMTAATTGWTDHRTGEDHEQWHRHLNGKTRPSPSAM